MGWTADNKRDQERSHNTAWRHQSRWTAEEDALVKACRWDEPTHVEAARSLAKVMGRTLFSVHRRSLYLQNGSLQCSVPAKMPPASKVQPPAPIVLRTGGALHIQPIQYLD